MEKDKNSQDKNYYKVIISELRDNPIRKVKMSFSLMGKYLF
jgi:hypothetical protein